MTQSLAELEQLCNVMYNSHNPNERAHAEGVLRPFSTNPEYIPQCKVRRVARCFSRVPTHSTTRQVRRHPGTNPRSFREARDTRPSADPDRRRLRVRRGRPARDARSPRDPPRPRSEARDRDQPTNPIGSELFFRATRGSGLATRPSLFRPSLSLTDTELHLRASCRSRDCFVPEQAILDSAASPYA